MSVTDTALSEKNDPNVNSPQKQDRCKRIADAFVIVFCVSGALFSLNLFRLDLLQSIASQNKKPVGSVTAKYNNVQRRLLDRVLWSRLTVESPVYSGDLIRVAEYSYATLKINDDVIDINENTMIRIRVSSDGNGRIIIDLSSGSLSITGSDAGGGVAINVMGRVITPVAGETLTVSAGESGMTLQVNEAQDADNSPAMSAQPEPELKSEVISKSETHSVPSSPQTPVLLSEEREFPPDVSVSSDGFISSTAGWKAIYHSSSMSDIIIARERIDGMEREVLTINATLAQGHSRWAGATLMEEVFFAKVIIEKTKSANWKGTTKTDMNLIRKLVNANGVRFKALGDGKRWRVYFATTDVAEGAYHGLTISTKKGEVGSFDIPFDKLNQFDWGRIIKFNKNNLKGITIEKSTDTGNYGTSSIKVFDFEVY